MNVPQYTMPQPLTGFTEIGDPATDWRSAGSFGNRTQNVGGSGDPSTGTYDAFSSQYPAPLTSSDFAADMFGKQANAKEESALAQIQQIFTSIMNALQNALSSATSPQTGFSNATLSSTGDPHLAMNGTDASGNAIASKYDSMTGHSDLVDSDSFDGGFRISTEVTAPNANGVTLNQSATIHSNYGQNAITLDAGGNATVTSNGQQIDLQTGQPIALDGGETVTKNQDGSLTVVNDNDTGGTVTTTMRSNGGGGVDVSATASNVDLGGDIVGASLPETARRTL